MCLYLHSNVGLCLNNISHEQILRHDDTCHDQKSHHDYAISDQTHHFSACHSIKHTRMVTNQFWPGTTLFRPEIVMFRSEIGLNQNAVVHGPSPV